MIEGAELDKYIQEYKEKNGAEPNLKQLEAYLQERLPPSYIPKEMLDEGRDSVTDTYQEVFGREMSDKEVDAYLKEFGVNDQDGR